MLNSDLRVCVCMSYMHAFLLEYLYAHASVHACILVYILVRTCIHPCIHTCACMCASLYVRARMHPCAHTYLYMHAHQLVRACTCVMHTYASAEIHPFTCCASLLSPKPFCSSHDSRYAQRQERSLGSKVRAAGCERCLRRRLGDRDFERRGKLGVHR